MKKGLKRTRYIILLLLLAVAVGAAACGSDDEEPATGGVEEISEVAQSDDANSADEANTEETTGGAEESAVQSTGDDGMVIEEIEGVTTDSGLQFIEIEPGDGDKPEVGDIVEVHYTGKLLDGTQFDSSVGSQPFGFQLGAGQVIAGWDEGLAMLNEGGKAVLIIPPGLGYGDRAADSIPANSTLMFDVQLVRNFGPPPTAPTEVSEDEYTETDTGLTYFDFEVGEGETPESDQTVRVHYTGWLMDGTKFDSSLDRRDPISFALGQGQVIPGWDEGISTMQVGGKRQLVVPPDLAYGDTGYGSVIPPESTLIFEVELVGIQE